MFRERTNISLLTFTKPIYKKIELDGVTFDLKIDPDNGLVDKEIYLNGAYEPKILRIIRKNINKDSICLDIGTNIGQHAIFMSLVASEGTIYAFEPLKLLVNQINDSINKNNIKNIQVNNFGLSNISGTQNVYLDNLNIGRTTFDIRKEAASIEKAEIKIFDEWWEDRSRVDFLKMDVEGYEYYALKGMKNMLEKYHPTMLIEFTPLFYKKMDIRSEDILNFIWDLGYSISDIEYNMTIINKADTSIFLDRVKVQTNIICVYEK